MLLATTLVPLALFLSPRVAPAPQRRASIHMGSLPAGAKVLVSGGGPLMLLTAKIAALRGFDVTAAVTPGDLELGPRLVEESAGVKYIQITGEGADGAAIDAKINEAQGLLLAIDSEASVPDSVIRVFVNPEAAPNLAHVGVMSRYLNGKGMGFIASTAKAAGNVDVWDGNGKAVAAYKQMEATVKERCAACGATWTIVRAGTLKGGASGAVKLDGGSGCADYLEPAFYKIGNQDLANWRMLYDIDAQGVVLEKGDGMAGPGFTAALTATATEPGGGDSGRGGVANALVESLRVAAADNADFSIGGAKAAAPPTPADWAALYAGAK